MTKTGVHVALLRGINVGGKHSVPMKPLAEMFTEAGCRDVRTHIQSGNVVFAASATLARTLPARIAAGIEERWGFAAPVQTRSVADLRAVVRANPFLARGDDPGTLAVLFLADAPGAKKLAALDPQRSPGDAFAARAREIYLACPNGMARTKLTNAWFDAQLATVGTFRNWRTTLALLEIAEG